MGVKSILFIIPLVVFSLFIVSCASEQEIKPEPKLYIMEEPQEKIFVIEDHNSISWVDNTKLQRHELNRVRALRDY